MSTMTPDHDVVARARRSKIRAHLAQLDYLRDLAEASRGAGVTQTEIARRLRVTQPAISQALKTATTTPTVPAGFHGARPYEIAERFAADEITREQLIDELARWPYAPADPGDGIDWNSYVPGEFNQVAQAMRDGLIDEETYTAIQDRADEIAAS